MKRARPPTGELNIWTGKRAGSRRPSGARVLAKTRLDLTRDRGGPTRGSLARALTFCIYWCHGHCLRNEKCHYKHSIPTETDEAELEVRSDIFGRERHGTHRDDLGGVGSFTDECRTLFIGGLPARATGKAGLLRTALQQQFGAWGTIASLRMRDGFAFVTYALRASAEFAREAMLNQSLGAPFDAVLNVRWASDDPNPRARQRQRAVAARAVVAAADAQQSQLQRLQHQNVLLGRQQRESEEQRAWRVWKQQGEAAPTPLAAADPGDAVGRGDRAGSSSDVLGLGGYSSSDASSDESP